MAAQLNRVQAEDYTRKVDNELRQQRRRLLALDTPPSVLLPQHLLGLPPSVKADYIADRLLFTLAVGAMHYYTSADLQAAQSWLSGCVGYLFQREEPPQRSFYYLIKLTELPQDARMAFFDGYRPASHPLRRDADMPKIFRELEVICVMAISGEKKLPM